MGVEVLTVVVKDVVLPAEIRSAAVSVNIPCITTVQGASAAVQGIEAALTGDIGVRSLQNRHADLAGRS